MKYLQLMQKLILGLPTYCKILHKKICGDNEYEERKNTDAVLYTGYSFLLSGYMQQVVISLSF